MLGKFIKHFEDFAFTSNDGVAKKPCASLLGLKDTASVILLLKLNEMLCTLDMILFLQNAGSSLVVSPYWLRNRLSAYERIDSLVF